MKLSTIDAVLLVAWLVGMVAFGLFKGGKQKSSADFMVGGRSLPWWLVLFSIVATETSTVTFLSVPGIAYGSGGNLTFLQLPLGYILGRLVVIRLLLPGYFKGELFTAYEVLRERFGGAVQMAASTLFVVTRTLADGLRLFLTAIVLEAVADVPMEQAVIAIGIATIIYTFLGGMRAVVWTDFIQFVVYMIGAAIAFVVLVGKVDGGLDGLITAADDADKLMMFDFIDDWSNPYWFWAGLAGGAVLSVATHGVDQMMVQRYLCAKSQAQASLALGLSGIVVWLQFAFFLLLGIGLWKFYGEHPPAAPFEKADRVFATFIVDELPIGVLGIVLGAVFSAAMSTLSSSLNSSATAVTNDIWAPLCGGLSDRSRLNIVRALTVVFGALQILVGIEAQHVDGSVVGHVLAIAGYVTGLVLGVFLLGKFAKHVGTIAAFVGMLAGGATVASIRFDALEFIGSADIAWPWFALIGSGTTFVVGAIVGLLLPRRS